MKNNFYRTQVNLGSDSWVRLSLRHRRCADLTDVTLADEDTNSKLTDNAKRAIQGNEAMQVNASYVNYASYACYASFASFASYASYASHAS